MVQGPVARAGSNPSTSLNGPNHIGTSGIDSISQRATQRQMRCNCRGQCTARAVGINRLNTRTTHPIWQAS